MDSCTLLVGVVTTALASLAQAQTIIGEFDAAKGTLPPAQGFKLVQAGPQPAATIAGGVLKQGLTAMDGWQCWQFDHVLHTSERIQIDAKILIESSTYFAQGCGAGQRTGYYIGVADHDGRMAYIGLGGDKVCTFNNVLATGGANAPVKSGNITGKWITLRMVISSAGTTLEIDGVPALSMPIGAVGASTPRDRVFFGDGTSCGQSRSQLAYLRVSIGDPCPADFNEDGVVDFMDYDDFVSCFEGNGCPVGKTADFDGDGSVDYFDYDAFVTAFEQGCGTTTDGSGDTGTGT
ncbi:MAG: hypothetical protein AABZ53_17035 [Planctomycetota bacterium]